MSEAQRERDDKDWLTSAQAELIAADNALPDLDGERELPIWIAHAHAQATVALVQKMEEIRSELELMNRRFRGGGEGKD